MKEFLKRLMDKKEIWICCILAATFTLLALFGNWSANYALEIFSKPLELLGNFLNGLTMRATSTVPMKIAGWAIYAVVCLLPLVYPLIKCIKAKRVHLNVIAWAAATAFLFATLYICINPKSLEFIVDTMQGMEETRLHFETFTKIGMAITFWVLIVLSVLLELNGTLKKDENKVFPLAKVLLWAAAVTVLYSVFYIQVAKAALAIRALPPIGNDSGIVINRGANIFAIVFTGAIKLYPAVFTLAILFRTDRFLSATKTELLQASNIVLLRGVIKSAKWAVFATLTAFVLENIMVLCLTKYLLNMFYNGSIPMLLLLTVCLAIVISKLLIRAIEVNEENKLVI